MKSFQVIIIFLLIPDWVMAQDITGWWKGYLSTNGNQLPYELVISREDDKFSGYSLTVFTIEGVENTGLKSMKLKYRNSKLIIEDDKLIEDNYSTRARRVMLWSSLTVTKKDTTWVLSGPFNSRAYNNPGYKGDIYLEKRSDYPEARLLAKLEQLNLRGTLSFLQPRVTEEKTMSPVVASAPGKGKATAVKKNEVKPENKDGKEIASAPVSVQAEQRKESLLPPPAADLVKRKIEPIQTIYFKSDSLRLSLFDNGQVDGDTVSVVWNGQAIIAREGLTARAITKTIYVPAGTADSLQLVMYAENLGRIPPNTGLLVIEDGERRYEVRFSGDLQKNSAIILKRRR